MGTFGKAGTSHQIYVWSPVIADDNDSAMIPGMRRKRHRFVAGDPFQLSERKRHLLNLDPNILGDVSAWMIL